MKWRWPIGWTVTYPIFRVLWGVKVHGRQYVPQRGALIIAANHMSFIDPPLMGHAAKRECFFLAKEELFEQSKFFRWLISYFNAIPIKRGNFDMHLFREVSKLMKKKQAVILFPEGTRSLKGKLRPFKTGVGMLALRHQVPIVPAYIKNTWRPVKEWINRKSQVEVYFAPPIYPEGSSHNKRDYEKITYSLEQEVHRLKDLAWSPEGTKSKQEKRTIHSCKEE